MAEKPGALDGPPPKKNTEKKTLRGPRKCGVEPVTQLRSSHSQSCHLY